MKSLSLILAVLLLASCSGMRSTGDTSGAGESGTSNSGSNQGDIYRPGR